MACENDGSRRKTGIFEVLFSGPGGRRRKYKWLGLASVFLFLACGGSIAWFMMKNAAHRLAGGPDSRLQSDSSLYGSNAGISRTGDFFASEEELAKADPALKNELLGLRAGQGAGARSSGVKVQGSEAGDRGSQESDQERDGGRRPGDRGQGSAAGSGMRSQLAARGGALAGPAGVETRQAAASGAGGGAANAATLRQMPDSGGRPAPAGAGKTGRTSVLASMRSALRAAIYGARTASKDTARNWTAKAFDGAADPEYSIEYDEKTKAALDRINPNSIPRFLKEQSLDADAARSLQMSGVVEPVEDPAGEAEALKGNKDFAQTLFPLFGMFGGGQSGPSAQDPAAGGVPPSDSPQDLNNLNLQDYIDTHGYGGECGCTPAAPCCCLPQNYYTGNGPLGDFPSL